MASIRTRYLSDEDAARLYREHPHIGRSPNNYCPTCAKKGTYRWQGVEHECDCEMQLQLYKHYLHAGIGATYQRLGWDDYHGQEAALQGLGKYLGAHDRFVPRGVGLIFYGPHGTGKTMLGNLALKELIKLRYSGFAATVPNTVKMFTAGWKSDDDRRYFESRFLSSEVLFLDDLGREAHYTTSQLSEVLFDNILQARTQYGRPTIISTNMTRPEIKERYGTGADSLLYEKTIECVLTGDDFRPQANRRELEEVAAGEVRPIV
jgi:DNA replication protein DnaC